MNRRIVVVGLLVAMMMAMGGVARAGNIGASGDIAPSPGGVRNDVKTAELLTSTANGIGLVLGLGDTQYECGQLSAYQTMYDTSWGPLKPITKAAPGNHEYIDCGTAVTGSGATETRESELAEESTQTPSSVGGTGFYSYFGGSACPAPGYCSFNYQNWHFVILNTTLSVLTQAQRDAQLAWFKQDLHNDLHRCQIVMGHHPYKASASPFTGYPDLGAYWPTMVTEDVEFYLIGHNHSYERTKPFRTMGNVDTDWGVNDGDDGHSGVQEVVAGLGGRSIIGFSGTPFSASAYRYAGNYGIFKIVPDYPATNQYITAFKTIDGQTLDRVSNTCH